MTLADPYFGVGIVKSRFLAESRMAFVVASPRAHVIVSADTYDAIKPRPWLRFHSRYTLGEKERQRDRSRYRRR